MSTARTSKAPWARLSARAVASVAMLSFAYASVACVANGALGLVDHHVQTPPVASSDSHHHHDDVPQGSHQGDSDSEQPCDDHGGPGNCCSSMTSILPSVQQMTSNPNQLSLLVAFVWALTADSALIAPRVDFTYEHGPPCLAPPAFLVAHSLSPRAPPLSV